MSVPKLKGKEIKIGLCFKAMELSVTVTIIILLIVGQYIYKITDDFTPVLHEKPNTTTTATTSNSANSTTTAITSSTTTTAPTTKARRPFKRYADPGRAVHKATTAFQASSPPMRLSWLLVMYPCCVTIGVVTLIKILEQVLKDPLSKPASLILVLLCIFLSVAIIAVSILSALTTFHIMTIIVSVLSGILLTFEIVECIFLLFS